MLQFLFWTGLLPLILGPLNFCWSAIRAFCISESRGFAISTASRLTRRVESCSSRRMWLKMPVGNWRLFLGFTTGILSLLFPLGFAISLFSLSIVSNIRPIGWTFKWNKCIYPKSATTLYVLSTVIRKYAQQYGNSIGGPMRSFWGMETFDIWGSEICSGH